MTEGGWKGIPVEGHALIRLFGLCMGPAESDQSRRQQGGLVVELPINRKDLLSIAQRHITAPHEKRAPPQSQLRID